MSAPAPTHSWTLELKERLTRLNSSPVALYPGTPAYNSQRDLINTIESTWRDYLFTLVRADLKAGLTGRRKHYWASQTCLIVYEIQQGATLDTLPATALTSNEKVDESLREAWLGKTVQHELYILTPQFSARGPASSPPTFEVESEASKSELAAPIIFDSATLPIATTTKSEITTVKNKDGNSAPTLTVPRTKVQRHSFSDSKSSTDFKTIMRTPSQSLSLLAPAACAIYTALGGSHASFQVLDKKSPAVVDHSSSKAVTEVHEDEDALDVPMATSRPSSPSGIPRFNELNAYPLGPNAVPSHPSPRTHKKMISISTAPADPYTPIYLEAAVFDSTPSPSRPTSPAPRFVQHTNNQLLPLPVSSPTHTSSFEGPLGSSSALVSLATIPTSLLRTGLQLQMTVAHLISSSVSLIFGSRVLPAPRPEGASGGGLFGAVAGLIWGRRRDPLLPTATPSPSGVEQGGVASLVQASSTAGRAWGL